MRKQTLLKFGFVLLLTMIVAAVPLPSSAGDDGGCDETAPTPYATCAQISCPSGTFCCPLTACTATCLEFGKPC